MRVGGFVQLQAEFSEGEWGGGVRWEAIHTEIKRGPGREGAGAWAWVRSKFR